MGEMTTTFYASGAYRLQILGIGDLHGGRHDLVEAHLEARPAPRRLAAPPQHLHRPRGIAATGDVLARYTSKSHTSHKVS
jgi:hypothetical protein